MVFTTAYMETVFIIKGVLAEVNIVVSPVIGKERKNKESSQRHAGSASKTPECGFTTASVSDLVFLIQGTRI